MGSSINNMFINGKLPDVPPVDGWQFARPQIEVLALSAVGNSEEGCAASGGRDEKVDGQQEGDYPCRINLAGTGNEEIPAWIAMTSVTLSLGVGDQPAGANVAVAAMEAVG